MTEKTEEIQTQNSKEGEPIESDSGIAAPNSNLSNRESEKSQDELADLKTQMAELNDRYVRLYSDFENFRRRTAKERLDLIKTSGSDALKDFIPVLDDLERATLNNSKSNDLEAIKAGIELIKSKLIATFKSKGVEEINPKRLPFDVDYHEAVTKIPVADPALRGCVVDVLEKGYKMDGHILRFAKVVVGE